MDLTGIILIAILAIAVIGLIVTFSIMFCRKRKNKVSVTEKTEAEQTVEAVAGQKDVECAERTTPAVAKETVEKKPAVKNAKKAAVQKDATPAKNDGEISEETAEAAKESSQVYHITKRSDDGLWQVKFGGSEKVIKIFDKQSDAILFTKKLAKKYDRSYIIHKVSGSFRKTTY